MDLNETVTHMLLQSIGLSDRQSDVKSLDQNALNNLLRLFSKWRSALLQNTFLQNGGSAVRSGIFAGMDMGPNAAEGCYVPKLLGTYEQPIQNHIRDLSSTDYQNIVNIGCAEGYYAVGLAGVFKDAPIHAYDINPAALETCRKLAVINQVTDRIRLAPEFKPSSFQDFSRQRVFYFVDIEGAEAALFSPGALAHLEHSDLIVECHSVRPNSITETLFGLFRQTHDVKIVFDNGMRTFENMPEWFFNLAHLDQLLSVWEWRSSPTPWIVASAKKQSRTG